VKTIIKILVVLNLFGSVYFAQGKVFVANIDREIDLGMAPYVKRAVAEAEKANAEAIIFNINTFGGRVDAATQIKDAILNCKVKTIGFIDKRAISAGSLISLSCSKIIMVPGGSIGATTVVDQKGEKQSEKYQSFMRSEMRSTAERYNRRGDIAEGMVDERVEIKGLVDSTHLITLTSKEALHYGIADTILTNFDSLLTYFSLQNAQIVEVKGSWAESLVRFLTNPIITSLLLMVIMVGMFMEIKTPGWGLPGTASVIALVLFFGSGYILDLASSLDILVFVVGVILLLLEIFVIPGFGIVGSLGILLIISGLFLGLISDFNLLNPEMLSTAVVELAAALLGSLIIMYILSKILPKTIMWNKLILKTNINAKSGYVSKKEASNLIGETGTVLTDLRPAGTIKIGNKRFDAVTAGEYILKGASIIVVAEEGSKIVVEEKS